MNTIMLLAAANSIHTVRWVNSLSARGFAVSLVSFEAPYHKIASQVAYHHIPRSTTLRDSSIQVWRLIHRIKPRLVHAHYASTYGRLASAIGFHPTVLSVWGSDVFVFPERSEAHACILREVLNDADTLTSTSRAMAAQLALYTDKTAEVIPFGVDLSTFVPVRNESVQVVIGTIKALEPIYGIDYLLRAFCIVKTRHPKGNLKLRIVGGGSQDCELRLLARQLGIDCDTEWTGKVMHEAVPHFLAPMSIFVTLSLSESFGVAVLEASACAKPVVVTNVGGLPEIVKHDSTGLIVKPRDAEGAADAIERLVSDEELRTRLGENGRTRAAKLFNWEHNVNQMIALYRLVW